MSLKKVFGIFGSKPSEQEEPLSKIIKFKTNFAMIGSTGAGKTTVNTLMVITSQEMSRLLPNFSCRTLPGKTGIIDYVSKMRDGHFPPKTNPESPVRHESGSVMRWDDWTGTKQIGIPVCDLAGEQLQKMITDLNMARGNPFSTDMLNINKNLISYVRDCDGYIPIVAAPRVHAFMDGLQLEPETKDETTGISTDPDANLYRFLEDIMKHKEDSRGKAIKAIAVVVTKWDRLMPYAQNMGVDLNDPEGMQTFMDRFMPQTMSLLKYEQRRHPNMKLRFFPSYVTIKTKSDGTPEQWPDGKDKVELEENQRVPKYWAQSYVSLINFLSEFAA